MLIHPAAIVALLLYWIAGPLIVPQRFQTRFKSLGHGAHQKISSVLSPPPAIFEPQDYPFAFEATIIEVLPVPSTETNVVHPAEVISPFPVPLEDSAEVVILEVSTTRHDDHPSPAPTRVFVVSPGYQGPFQCCDLFIHRVLDVLTAICVSILFPLVVIPFFTRLFSRSESLYETERPIDVLPKRLPPKILAPPPTVQIRVFNPKSHAPLEPIFSPAPPVSSAFWLASEQQRQDRPSSPTPPLLRLLDFSALENEFQKKLSPLSSPADSGYGTTLPDTASDVSSLVPDESVTTTPEHLTKLLPTADAESTCVHDSNNVTTTSDNFTGEQTNTAGYDTELEDDDDDDDGSTTVTSSTANLADLIARPAPAPAEVATKLESVMAALIEEAEPLPEPPVEDLSVTVSLSNDLAADIPSHDGPATDLPSNGDSVADLGTSIHESVAEEISVNICPHFEPSSDATDAVVDFVGIVEKAAASTGLEAVTGEDETTIEDDLPSHDDSEQGVEFWIPGHEIPTIVVSPPSEVDPEDSTQQLDSKDEREESEDIIDPDYEDELDYADDCPDYSVVSSPVEPRDDPCRSPRITGKLWSDDEGDDLGPLPFSEEPKATDVVEQIEAQGSPIEEEMSEVATATPEDSDVGEPVVETVQELVEEPQPTPEAPAQEVVEPTPAAPAPSPSPSLSLQSPPHISRSYPTRTQASFDNEDRSEGSSRSGRMPEPQRLQYFHCCKLYKSDGRPKSWENWKIEKPKACIPMKTHLQEWQFVRPTDEDGENPTTRIAVDNLDADWFRTVDGVLSYNYLTEAMKFFSTKSFRCWRGRTIDGIEYPSIGYATIDFNSLDEAIRMFEELQGRRLRGHTWHWRLEFVDPSDDTHGGRRVVRTELVPDSVKEALAAELEASTRRHGRYSQSEDAGTDTFGVMRPPSRARPQLTIGGRSLFAGAMANAVQGRRTEEQPAQSTTRVPTRRPYRS